MTKPSSAHTLAKFSNPDWTAKGEARATVRLKKLEVLWINTGTLCNITCRNCYIESSPTNDRLSYLKVEDIRPLLFEARELGVVEIGWTGGEPFLNPEFEKLLSHSLASGFKNLILTNAMMPMQRPPVKEWLLGLHQNFDDLLKLRISLDHYTPEAHNLERGNGSYEKAIEGINWLVAHGFRISIAGRSFVNEAHASVVEGYQLLFRKEGWPLDAKKTSDFVLFPEMDNSTDVPEITQGCWEILGKSPDTLMCATSRMVVKRKDSRTCVILPCTLLPYNEEFEMGSTLSEAALVDGGLFIDGAVKLAHPHCAKFCVLGGGSCSG